MFFTDLSEHDLLKYSCERYFFKRNLPDFTTKFSPKHIHMQNTEKLNTKNHSPFPYQLLSAPENTHT